VQTTGKKEVPSVTTIVQDRRPGKTHIWYFAGGEVFGNSAGTSKGTSYYGNGIFKSTDNGLTWAPLPGTSSESPHRYDTFDQIHRLVLDHKTLDQDIIYAASVGGVFRSSDGGESWTTVLGDASDLNSGPQHTEIVMSEFGILYAGLSSNSSNWSSATQSGFFRSTDGIEWEEITPDGFLKGSRRTVIAAAADDKLVYFLTYHSNNNGTYCPDGYGCSSLYVLDDNSNPGDWYDLSENLPIINSGLNYGIFKSQSGYNMCIAVKPDDSYYVVIGGTNLYVSSYSFMSSENTKWVGGYNPDYDPTIFTDYNATWLEKIAEWRNMMFPTSGWDFHTIVFHPDNPDIMITGSDHGLHRVNNFKEAYKSGNFTWDDLNNGYNTTQFYDCSIHPTEAGNETIIGGMQDNGTWGTFTSNVEFEEMTGGDGMHSVINQNGDILVSSQMGYIMRMIYEDGKLVGGYQFQPEDHLGIQFSFYNPFEINPNNTNSLVMGAASGIVYCSDYTDGKKAYQNWSFRDMGWVNITSMAFATTPANTLYVGTSYKGIYKIADVTNSSSNIKQISYPSDVNYGYTSDIWVDPMNGDHIIAIISNYYSRSILETTDGGDSWTDHGGNLEEFEDGSGSGPSVRSYARLNTKEGVVHFVGTSAGLYSTKNLDGANTEWIREGENTIGMAVVSKVHARQSDGRIVVSTHGNGLFKTNYSTSIEDFDAASLGFAISEIYPNPSAGMLHFVINSDDRAFVEARLLDLQGKEIAKVISEEFSGTKKVHYDATNLPNGTYFLNISDGTHFVTKKISIAK
jgi:photosystem II stability/assembly factor-like uncharacterized protein